MATPLICLKISPENVKQLSVKTSSAKRSSVSVEGSLTVRWSKKYLSAKSPSLFGITVYREVMSMVKRNLLLHGKLNCFKMFSACSCPLYRLAEIDMEICGIYLHLGNNETRKRKEQRLIFKLGTLAPNGINERFSFA